MQVFVTLYSMIAIWYFRKPDITEKLNLLPVNIKYLVHNLHSLIEREIIIAYVLYIIYI